MNEKASMRQSCQCFRGSKSRDGTTGCHVPTGVTAKQGRLYSMGEAVGWNPSLSTALPRWGSRFSGLLHIISYQFGGEWENGGSMAVIIKNQMVYTLHQVFSKTQTKIKLSHPVSQVI
jgi:hypothetical protein